MMLDWGVIVFFGYLFLGAFCIVAIQWWEEAEAGEILVAGLFWPVVLVILLPKLLWRGARRGPKLLWRVIKLAARV